MDNEKYLDFIKNFNPDSKENIDKLENLINDYPYYTTPKLYYLKILKDNKSKKYDSELKKMAISVYNRSWLFDWINKPWENKKSKIPIKNNKLNDEIRQKNDSKKMNFTDWINYIQDNPSDEKNSKFINEKFHLIEKFLNNTSKIHKDKISQNKEDMSKKSLILSNELMTETLAKIYLKQKKYKKAIEAYKILSLKYPEKNVFFANQIKKIKKLDNTK